ncbi:sensor histidine kinase, partial [Leclercia adecarboxylata]
LATNAVKYGALSVPDGVVDLDITENGDDITLIWRESGGPTLSGPPTHQGFGTKLATMSIEQQLGGTFTRHWEPSGLVAIVAIKHTQLVRQRKA